MCHRRLFTLATILAALVPSLTASAQVQGQTSISPQCTYATCALRVEGGWFGLSLVKGASGERHRLWGLGGGVSELLASSDSAAHYARSYVRDTRVATGLTIVAAAAAFYAYAKRDDENVSIPAVGVSLGFTVVSLPFLLSANRNLSRAVWWYNASVPR